MTTASVLLLHTAQHGNKKVKWQGQIQCKHSHHIENERVLLLFDVLCAKKHTKRTIHRICIVVYVFLCTLALSASRQKNLLPFVFVQTCSTLLLSLWQTSVEMMYTVERAMFRYTGMKKDGPAEEVRTNCAVVKAQMR